LASNQDHLQFLVIDRSRWITKRVTKLCAEGNADEDLVGAV